MVNRVFHCLFVEALKSVGFMPRVDSECEMASV